MTSADVIPPSYDDVTKSADESENESGNANEAVEAPPSYYSLFPSSLSPNNIGRQVRRGISSGGDGEDSSGSGNRATSVAKISGCLGSLNVGECRIESQLPIWLIVMGVFQLLEGSCRLCYHTSRQESDDNELSKDPVVLFLVVWFIVGNVFVFKNWTDYTPIKLNGTMINENYCDQLTMRFAFWTIVSYYIICGVVCVCVCGAVWSKSNSDSD
ncbi:uncharacterized protein LOC134182652 isoform X2 [Corticium candelabrum]|uniref:uncharacterized protein LOC134182652 isoform X2 n=1 Tax=Corticium candelabrum TaxID=121492 RepID=UPI002E2661F9|nr:uncharacterized protein LOC134182652 isoform X2 [Corticium candelabrum]